MITFFKQFVAYLKPIKGHGTIGMFQRTIVYSEWVLVVSVISSIVLESFNTGHGGWIQFFENFAIGIACSDVIVIVTVVIQFLSERDRKLSRYKSSVLIICMYLYKYRKAYINSETENTQVYVGELAKGIKQYRDDSIKLFWFNVKTNDQYNKLDNCLARFTLWLYYYENDVYSMEEKEIRECITYARDFFDSVNTVKYNPLEKIVQFINSGDLDEQKVKPKNEGENNDQL